MKLNYRQTVCVGLAFFLICAFWQAYDNTIPMILTNKFGMSQTWSGFIMALDNILALFLLPLFGTLSDRTKTRLGKRTPFILAGTLAAVIFFTLLGVMDARQLQALGPLGQVNDDAGQSAVYIAAEEMPLQSPDGERFVLNEVMDAGDFIALRTDSEDEAGRNLYTAYAVPARQAAAAQITHANPQILTGFIALLLLTLLSMSVFRSPAVALMPDVTLKVHRSRANAVINLMGAAGGILVLALGMVFRTSAPENAMMSYLGYFGIVALLMLVSLIVFLLTVREPKLAEKAESMGRKLEESDGEKTGSGSLSAGHRRSLLFLLLSIVLWFMGYNAITSKYSVYATTILHKNYNLTLIIAQAAAIVSYIPVGQVASHIGRKKTILAGVAMLALAFFLASFMHEESSAVLMYLIFALAGIAWATINVNSFPMVVEMCTGADVGRYTGIYYTASMAAQILTPILSGFLMDRLGMRILFPYAVVFVALSFVTMLFARHGDVKPEALRGLEALGEMD